MFIAALFTAIKIWEQSSHCGSEETNPTSIYEDADPILGLTQWVKDLALPQTAA